MIGFNINVLQQTTCLVVNPITVSNFAFLFNWTPMGLTSDSIIVSEYDQEIPQSQTADNPVAPRGRAAKPSRDTGKTN